MYFIYGVGTKMKIQANTFKYFLLEMKRLLGNVMFSEPDSGLYMLSQDLNE